MLKMILNGIRGLLLWSVLALLAGCSQHMGGLIDPKGPITVAEKQLFMDSIALMLIVVIPVIIMSFAFAYRYRAKNTKATYRPNWSHSNLLEFIWWAVPCVIIVVLGILTWKKNTPAGSLSKTRYAG